MASAVPPKKKDDKKAPSTSMSTTMNAPRVNTTAELETIAASKKEEASKDAEHMEVIAPWMLREPTSSLSLGDASAVQRIMREEKLPRAEAERKVRWQRDEKNKGLKGSDVAPVISK
jgi:hypothetical protein